MMHTLLKRSLQPAHPRGRQAHSLRIICRSTLQGLSLILLLGLNACSSTPTESPDHQQQKDTAPPVDATPADTRPSDTRPSDTRTSAQPDDMAVPEDARNTQHYTLKDGELIIHVGRAGRLAKLGHNHLIASTALRGHAVQSAEGSLDAQVSVAVNTLTVDDPALRDRYRQHPSTEVDWAEVYASRPTPKHIAATRKNMLGERVLDAQAYPEISARAVVALQGDALQGAGPIESEAEVSIQLRDTTVTVPARLSWERHSATRIHWRTRLRLTHSELGLRPFSALAGALTVAEELVLELSGALVADSPQ